ncbi:RIP metalloprotease RseP [Pelotomaculum propionicicum]|uniref:Zinc metalloprotease n=1 Tax=Pelotomaculum propionicicum TaxID=258475 RepID=A0A4Y7RMW8_9FIRM|nr:RIP metalloprotease RseP [Pelotomaculum propionicicum]TEB10171.1 Regulator of sigma-W protease RasP [Pelotomaculum propionicicum]
MLTAVASIFVFGLLIFFHEFGHFMIAKLVGIKVYEFSLSFGPKLITVPGADTTYNLRLLPLGGFVRMAGMEPNEEIDVLDQDRVFNKKTVFQRISVIIAGPIMNFFLAILLLAVMISFQGEPVPSNVSGAGEVIAGAPAQKAGIMAGDKIVAVDGQPINTWEELVAVIGARPDQEITVDVIRNNEKLQLAMKTERNEAGQGKIGIYPMEEYKRVGPLRALSLGAEWTVKITVTIMDFISKMIFGQAPPDLGGPVRVVTEIGKAAHVGFFMLIQMAAILSINLGLFNLFPIPALDGSRILFLIWEKLRGRPVDPVRENFIHLVGFGLLLLLMVVITYNDILHIFVVNQGSGLQ